MSIFRDRYRFPVGCILGRDRKYKRERGNLLAGARGKRNISWTYSRAAFDKINDKITKRCPEKIYCARKLDIRGEKLFFLTLSLSLSSLFSCCICVGYTALIIKISDRFIDYFIFVFIYGISNGWFFYACVLLHFRGNRWKMTKIRDKCLSKIRDRVSFFIIDIPILVKFADRDRTLSRLYNIYITLKSFSPFYFTIYNRYLIFKI